MDNSKGLIINHVQLHSVGFASYLNSVNLQLAPVGLNQKLCAPAIKPSTASPDTVLIYLKIKQGLPYWPMVPSTKAHSPISLPMNITKAAESFKRSDSRACTALQVKRGSGYSLFFEALILANNFCADGMSPFFAACTRSSSRPMFGQSVCASCSRDQTSLPGRFPFVTLL